MRLHKDLTADSLASDAGTSLRDVARLWPTDRPRLKESQIKNRVARIRKAVRHGGIKSSASACRLASLLQCPAMTFLYGASHNYDNDRSSHA